MEGYLSVEAYSVLGSTYQIKVQQQLQSEEAETLQLDFDSLPDSRFQHN